MGESWLWTLSAGPRALLSSSPLPFLPSGVVLVLGKILIVSLEASTELAT